MAQQDPIDLISLLEGKNKIPVKESTHHPSYDTEITTGFGKSKYDEQFFPDAQLNKDGTGLDLLEIINERRSNKQSNLAKASAGVARAGAKAVTEIAKIPGILGGVIAAPFAEEGEGWETAFNNSWIKTVNELGEGINSELLPVYVKKSVSEGNLWDNISSIDFWATEGADGVGYMASMLAPGALLNKFRLGEKLFKGIGSASNILNKSDEAAALMSRLGVTPQNIDMTAITAGNTLFEAAVEAQGAGDKYMADIDEQLSLGAITIEDAKLKKAEVMRNVFIANAAILMGPNAIMSKMLWGKGSSKMASKFMDDTGNIAASIPDKSIAGKVGDITKDIALASGREGFFEEGLQSTAENYFTNKAVAGESPSILESLSDLPREYLNTINTTDGQKAIFLGSILGGGMQSYQGYKQRKRDNTSANKLLAELNKVDGFFKIFSSEIYNEEGSINSTQLKEKLQAFDNTEKLGELFDEAITNGDTKVINALRAFTSGEVIKPFIFNGDMGMDALNEYLEKSKEIQEIAQKENSEIDDIIVPIKERAVKLQKDYNVFSEFAPSIINLKEGTKEDKMMYYDNLASQYITRKNMKYSYQSELSSLKDKRSELLESIGLARELVTEDEVLVSKELDNLALKEINDDVRNYEKLLKDIAKDDNNFWKSETHDKEYSERVNLLNKIREAQEKEDEIEKATNSINNATTVEEVDDVALTNTVADKAINELKKSKKKEIEDELAAQRESQLKDQQERDAELKDKEFQDLSNVNDFVENIANNYNIGETIEVPSIISEAHKGKSAEITDINEDNITLSITDESGVSEIVVGRNKEVVTSSNVESDFVTEGSINHDSLIPKDSKQNISSTESKTGSKVISTDEKGKPFGFISKAYLDYEKTPINKVGKTVTFKVNDTKLNNDKWNNAIKGYNKLAKGESLTQKEKTFLINHLPINAVFADGVEAPIETLPSTKSSEAIFNKSSKLLRTNILNSLFNGSKIEDLSTTVEGQYGGVLKIADKVSNNVPENSILDLYHFKGMSKKQKVDYILDNLGYIRENGDIQMINGSVNYFSKEDAPSKTNAKGEVYLMIPKANGKPFPLKLNIKKISEGYSELLYNLNAYRLDNKDQSDLTSLSEIRDKDLVKGIKDNFKDELKLIGKKINDVTIKDIIEFLVWETTGNPKSKLSFIDKDKTLFVYGNNKTTGGQATESANLDKEQFKEWLQNNKRQSINIKPKVNQDSKSNISDNLKYLEYLLDKGILNTNAVINEPTFGGYTNIYLNSNNISKPSSNKNSTSITNNSPYDIKTDGSNLFSSVIDGKEYYSSSKTGRVFKGNPIDKTKAIPSDNSFVGELITDNNIIESVENEIRTVNYFADPNISLTRYNESNPSGVTNLEDIQNTPEKKLVDSNKNDIIKKDNLNVTKDIVSELFKRLVSNKLVKIGNQSKSLLSGTNQESFNKLKEIADKHNVAINDIITKCK